MPGGLAKESPPGFSAHMDCRLPWGTNLVVYCPFRSLDSVVDIKFESHLVSQAAFVGEARLQVKAALLLDTRPVVLILKSTSRFLRDLPT